MLLFFVFTMAISLVFVQQAYAALLNPRFAYVKAPASNEVLVNWEQTVSTPNGTVTYHVHRSTAFDGDFVEIGTSVGLNNCSYVDTGGATPLSYLTEYFYKISVSDTDPETDPVFMTGTPIAPYTQAGLMSSTTGPPREPRGVEATCSVTDYTVNSITLTWDPVSGPNVARYAIWKLTESGTDGTLIGTTTSTETPSFVDTSTSYVEHHYWYRVAAVATDGSVEATGGKSFELQVRPLATIEIDVPHGSVDASGDSCMSCHDMHVAPAPHLLMILEADPSEYCLSCHDGTGSKYNIKEEIEDTSAHSLHPISAAAGDLTCMDCHTPHGDPDAEGCFKLVNAYGFTEGVWFCLVCHQAEGDRPAGESGRTYTTRTSDFTMFVDSAHNATSVANPPSGTGIKCRTCHLSHTSPNEDLLMYTGYRACFNCHAGSTSLSSPDIYTRMTASSDIDAHHDVLRRDQSQDHSGRMECQNCHNSHSATEETPWINPYNPSPHDPFDYMDAPAEVRAVTTSTDNAFCLSCHKDGNGEDTLPTSEDTSPWVAPPVWSDMHEDGGTDCDFEDITNVWATAKHGGGPAVSVVINPAATSAGYAADQELLCEHCHDPHGTVNARNVRSDIYSFDRSTNMITGVLLVELGDGAYDSRFFCMTCHNQDGHTGRFKTFPATCMDGSCHGHVSANTF